MFQDRRWPEGLEFPSCDSCNLGTRDYDLLASMFARMDPVENKGNKDGRQLGLMKAVNKQFPGLFQRMMPTASEARRHNREYGLTPAPGQTHQETGMVKVPSELHEAVCALARKLAKGLFYRETGSIFSNDGCLLLNWFTNTELLRANQYPQFENLKNLAGFVPSVVRSGTYLHDQFEYKLSLSAEKTILVLQARFGNAFGFVLFGSTLVGLLEGVVTRLREESKRQGPFAVLQSPTLS
jgi:hypothetical protein